MNVMMALKMKLKKWRERRVSARQPGVKLHDTTTHSQRHPESPDRPSNVLDRLACIAETNMAETG
jgi:hypothetical protein